MHYWLYLSKVQIREGYVKYSDEVFVLCYIPPLALSELEFDTPALQDSELQIIEIPDSDTQTPPPW